MAKTRYRNFGTKNDRAMIKARQKLSVSDWIENLKWNKEQAKQKLAEKRSATLNIKKSEADKDYL